MFRIGLLLFGIAASLAISPAAEARDGCGRGFYFDGYGCVRQPYYGPPPGAYYAPPPGYYGPAPGPTIQFNLGGGGNDRRYAAPVRGHCQRGFTVQDGLCKPYRGY